MTMEVKAKVPIVLAVDYSKDGKSVASFGMDQTARIWDMVGARQAMLFKESTHGYVVGRVAYSPDGKIIATAGMSGRTIYSNNVTILRYISTGKEIGRIDGMGGELSFSADGRYILGNINEEDRTLRLWDVQTNSVVREFNNPYGHEGHGRISPDKKYIVAWGDKVSDSVSLIDVATGKEIWREETNGVAAFLPEVQQLLIASTSHGFWKGGDITTSFKLYDT
ncbi:MAG: hypothetical protein WC825_12810, partial [Gallionellaceae bacterium]